MTIALLLINKPFRLLQMLSVVSAGAAAGMGGMDRLRGGGRAAARELAASRDRQVRLHAVRTDLTLNLPPSIALPDGEEHRTSYSSAAASRLQLRDAEQVRIVFRMQIKNMFIDNVNALNIIQVHDDFDQMTLLST